MEFEWSETTSRTLHYPAIAPGDYRLELQAVDPTRRCSRLLSPCVLPFGLLVANAGDVPSALPRLLCGIHRLVALAGAPECSIASASCDNWSRNEPRELEAEKAELMAAREALSHQATRDALPGIWNRSAIIDILIREMDRSRRTGVPLAVVLADIDHFKQVNDTLGHLAGDSIPARCRQPHASPHPALRLHRSLWREEFLLVMPGLAVTDPAWPPQSGAAGDLGMSRSEFEDESVPVGTSSFGAAWYGPDTKVVEDLIRRVATKLSYRAKAEGRNRILFYEEQDPS